MSNNHKNRDYGRWRTARSAKSENATILRMLQSHQIITTPAEASAFMQWMINDVWEKYQKDCMDKQVIAMNRVNSVDLTIANGTKGKSYLSDAICLPTDVAYDYEFEGLEELGLTAVKSEDQGIYYIHGVPNQAGDFTIKLKYKYEGWTPGKPVLERKIAFAVNADPREIMEKSQRPTPNDIPYYKDDQECEYIKVEAGADGMPRKDIVAASNRGRSHGREGKARDDHYQVTYNPANEWYILAVADGAGSAKYARKGSEIACRIVTEYCSEKLADAAAFEAQIRAYRTADDEEAARKELGNVIYSILCNAAYKAHKAIAEEAQKTHDAKAKDFATTLMLAVCKKFDFGWFYASFWIGDGAMCLYDRERQTHRLLGVPDEGEFSGQTRFLTMPEIFSDRAGLFRRLRFDIVDDFTALFLMTDGVSDPMFGTEASLGSIDKWNEFWDTLHTGFPADSIPGVALTDDNNEAKYQLLRWLDFWKRGEHDDRTIAILY